MFPAHCAGLQVALRAVLFSFHDSSTRMPLVEVHKGGACKNIHQKRPSRIGSKCPVSEQRMTWQLGLITRLKAVGAEMSEQNKEHENQAFVQETNRFGK